MTTYFITRHPGAVEWAARQSIEVDKQIAHLDVEILQAGDWVLGTLPVNLAAIVCERGGRYFHLSLDIPQALRGADLSADQMTEFNSRLECFDIRRHRSRDTA